MSEKITELKAKLLKQKEKNIKKVSVKKKSKLVEKKKKSRNVLENVTVEKPKIPKIATNVTRIEKSGKEEEKFRNDLRKLSQGEYDELKAFHIFNERHQKTMKDMYPDDENVSLNSREAWEVLDEDSKKEFALESLAGGKENWGISGLIQKLLKLPVELQEDFITTYIDKDQPLKYDAYYEKWLQFPRISNSIKEYNEKKDTDFTGRIGEMEKMRMDLYNKAKEYAQKKGIELEEDDKSYWEVLKKVTSNPQKLHKKLAKNYIEVAESLGAENAGDMTVANLIEYINRERKKLLRSVNPEKAKKIKEMSHKKLLREAQKLGIEEGPEDVLIIKLLQSISERFRTVNRDDLIKEAKYLKIP